MCDKNWGEKRGREEKHTKLVANKSTSGDTSYTGSSQHSSRVTLLFLCLIGSLARSSIVVSLVAVGVSEQATLIVTSCGHVGCAGGWRSVWAWWQMGGWVPLCTSSSLLNVKPALAVLVPLLGPARRHWRRCAVRRWWAYWWGWTLTVRLLLRVALGWVTLGWVSLTLRRVALSLRGRITLTLGRRITLTLGRTTVSIV